MSSAERPRSLGEVIRTLFARRPDPYFGNDVDNARRLGGLMWLIYGTVAAILLPLAPPERALRDRGLDRGSLDRRRSAAHGAALAAAQGGFNTLLRGSYLAVAQLATLQALAGSGASAYQELYLLLAVYTAAVHRPPHGAVPARAVGRRMPAAPLPGLDVGDRRRPRGAAVAVARAVGDDDDRDRAAARAAAGAPGRDRSTRRSWRCRTRSPASATAAG